jgi:hypothetical protein
VNDLVADVVQEALVVRNNEESFLPALKVTTEGENEGLVKDCSYGRKRALPVPFIEEASTSSSFKRGSGQFQFL